MMFCLSSNQLLDKTIFRDADDTSGHEAKENLSSSEKFLLSRHKKLRLPENNAKTRTSRHLQTGASNRKITGQPVARGPKQLETRRKSPGNVQPNPKVNPFRSRFPTRAIHRSRRTGMRYAPYFFPYPCRDPAFLPTSSPRFYVLRPTRRTGRGKSNRVASEGTEPATSRVCPSRHAACGCARQNRFSCPTVSTICLRSLSQQPVSTAQQPCWLGELWPMSAKHGSTKFLDKRSPLNAPSRSCPLSAVLWPSSPRHYTMMLLVDS